jgi:hypothetical protein
MLALALLLAACGGNAIDPAASWVATLDFTCDRWLANRVPSRFVQNTAQSAKKALEKSLKSAGEGEPEIRDALAAIDDLTQAIDRGDRAAVGRARMRFAASYAALHAIEEAHQ